MYVYVYIYIYIHTYYPEGVSSREVSNRVVSVFPRIPEVFHSRGGEVNVPRQETPPIFRRPHIIRTSII